MAYAADTIVSVEKSRAEIEGLLMRHGAGKFATAIEPDRAMIGFVIRDRTVRFVLPLPNPTDEQFQYTPKGRYVRKPKDQHQAWEQACRSKWRALCLCIKAKLEAVEAGITTFEEEFLAHIVLPNARGQTLGEALIPQMDNLYANGKAPKLLEM